MIKTIDAVNTARSLIGTPYSTLDCINLIKYVIRKSPGGVSDYTTSGTNTLWDSYDYADKYRDLTYRQNGNDYAKAGMLAFKRNESDVHHVGLVTYDNTVIHSSSVYQQVVETPLDDSWDLLAKHRYIEVDESNNNTVEEGNSSTMFGDAYVSTSSTGLRLRSEPNLSSKVLTELPKGTRVEIVRVLDGWLFVRTEDDTAGYVSSSYITADEVVEVEDGSSMIETRIVIRDSEGNYFYPVGSFTVFSSDQLND